MGYANGMIAGALLSSAALLSGCDDATSTSNMSDITTARPTTKIVMKRTERTGGIDDVGPKTGVDAPASTVSVKTDDYDFSYSYPSAVLTYPELTTWLDADRESTRAEVARDSAAFRRQTKANDFPFRKYESSTEWKVVTEVPRLLSLSAEIYDYTGGAHGSTGFRATVWDRAAARRVAPEAMFTSASAIQAAVGDAFCAALDRERARRRGAPVVRDADTFSTCPRVADTTMILGSSDRRTIDRIGFLVGPYIAGPYAEGSYDVTLPVTPAVVAAVRPVYRNAFTAR